MNETVSVAGVEASGATKDDYQFTQDWFTVGRHVWPQLITHLPEKQQRRRLLEIGSFEGRSAVWMIEHMMGFADELLCIDTWQGGEEHSELDMNAVEKRFDHNIAVAQSKYGYRDICKVKKDSLSAMVDELSWRFDDSQKFDFIYIDGSHQAKDVLADAVFAWKLLRNKGILIFDDYLWGDPRMALNRPKMAIDAFMNIFATEIGVMHIGAQVAIAKWDFSKAK